MTHTVSHGAPVPSRPVPTSPNGEVSSPPGSDFAAFYAAFPRKVGRKDAERKWLKAIKDGASPADLLAGAERYARERDGQDPKYTKHPASWLHQGCWMDEPGLRLVSGDGYRPFTNPTNHDAYDEELI